MKNIVLISFCVLLIGISSCCSKKGACPIIEFEKVELINFESFEVSDSIGFVTYKAGTNFTQKLDSQLVSSSPTDDPNKVVLSNGALSSDFDYAVHVLKAGKVYQINNYTVKKIACGKCFMRSNNQFGYELTSYAVNGQSKAYEGAVSLVK